jgi:hypothetical protein
VSKVGFLFCGKADSFNGKIVSSKAGDEFSQENSELAAG